MEKLQKEFDDLKDKHETNEKALKDRDETIKNNNMGKVSLYTNIYYLCFWVGNVTMPW